MWPLPCKLLWLQIFSLQWAKARPSSPAQPLTSQPKSHSISALLKKMLLCCGSAASCTPHPPPWLHLLSLLSHHCLKATDGTKIPWQKQTKGKILPLTKGQNPEIITSQEVFHLHLHHSLGENLFHSQMSDNAVNNEVFYSVFSQLVLGSLIMLFKGLCIILTNGFCSYSLLHLDLSFPESPLVIKPHIV